MLCAINWCREVNMILMKKERERVNETFYKKIAGSLMYITTTRPDLQFVVRLLSRYMSRPTKLHLQATKRVLRYLKVWWILVFGITKKELESYLYTLSVTLLEMYSKKSTSGYVYLMDDPVVAWSSKKKSIVTLSTTEVEMWLHLCVLVKLFGSRGF